MFNASIILLFLYIIFLFFFHILILYLCYGHFYFSVYMLLSFFITSIICFCYFYNFFLYYFSQCLTFFRFISFLVPPGLYSFTTASIHMDTNKQIGSCFVCQISS